MLGYDRAWPSRAYSSPASPVATWPHVNLTLTWSEIDVCVDVANTDVAQYNAKRQASWARTQNRQVPTRMHISWCTLVQHATEVILLLYDISAERSRDVCYVGSLIHVRVLHIWGAFVSECTTVSRTLLYGVKFESDICFSKLRFSKGYLVPNIDWIERR